MIIRKLGIRRLLVALLLSGIIGCCYSYGDEDNSLDSHSHEITERNPNPDPARGRGRYSGYSGYSSTQSRYSRYSNKQSYYEGTASKTPTIDPFKAQSERDQNIADQCYSPDDYQCNAKDKYRTIDGTCNNLRRPWWGAANSAHVRLMQPYYEDGSSEYRRSQVDSSELPSPRLLSQVFLPDRNVSDIHTRMYLQFSQLVAHDILLNAQESTGPKCCSDSGDAIQSTSGNCRPISIPSNDPFYSQFNRKCMEYKHSEAINCSVEPFQPVVQTTSFMDASFVYGPLPDKARDLRSFSRGQLTVRRVNGKAYLPLDDPSECPFAPKFCYKAGDVRVNQNLDLAAKQTLWLLFHNYVADKLIQLNPHWSNRDELVYQEARRIVGAVFQHITYNEWLPILVGKDYAKDVGLAPTESGYFSGYSQKVNPSTLADFAGGAFRGLHSLIPTIIQLADERRVTTRQILYASTMQHPGDFLEEGDTYDSVLRGLGVQREDIQDRFMTQQITNFLADPDVPESGRALFGDDLSARDIQRGRDYGLRPYVDYRQLCGLSKASSFRDLNDFIESDQITRLSQVYKDVRDIDYYIGGLLEGVVQGTLSSPSFRCVFVEAFYRYKYGDRYFYEGSPSYNPGAFTPAQLTAIKGAFLSQIICIGSDSISQMQVHAFYQPSQSNPLVSCAQLQSDFDNILNLFQEES